MAVAPPLLDVRDLTIEYPRGRNLPSFKAVDGVSLQVQPGETVGLVGESGAGKSSLGNAVLGLAPVSSGAITFAGTDITQSNARERRTLSAHLQVVFQNPYSSLNPLRTVGQAVAEPLEVHRDLSRRERDAEVARMLQRVGLPADAASGYPSQFSGGQRQRIAIARALIMAPRLVICDEPVSALDLSVQAQIINLLRDLQDELGTSYLFVSHDLAVVRNISHRILVLYHGRVMESGPAGQVSGSPGHPYTRALLAAAPVPNPELQRRRRAARQALTLAGRPGTLAGAGCPFAPRCPHAIAVCREERPALVPVSGDTFAACHRYAELNAGKMRKAGA
jgi:peptide/nickel transport system ATP-binding protein